MIAGPAIRSPARTVRGSAGGASHREENRLGRFHVQSYIVASDTRQQLSCLSGKLFVMASAALIRQRRHPTRRHRLPRTSDTSNPVRAA